MTEEKNANIETDIALIKQDIRQIERVFKKVDDAISKMSEILKTLAVQETVLENNDKRLTLLEQKMILHTEEESKARDEFRKELHTMREANRDDREKRHKELLEALDKMNSTLTTKLDNQDKRIRDLENWRWYIIGIGVVLLIIISNIPWPTFSG
jgi:flagellar biosynthesis GTPase FlhF